MTDPHSDVSRDLPKHDLHKREKLVQEINSNNTEEPTLIPADHSDYSETEFSSILAVLVNENKKTAQPTRNSQTQPNPSDAQESSVIMGEQSQDRVSETQGKVKEKCHDSAESSHKRSAVVKKNSKNTGKKTAPSTDVVENLQTEKPNDAQEPSFVLGEQSQDGVSETQGKVTEKGGGTPPNTHQQI